MSNKLLFLIGILGVTFFATASFLGGFQFENYETVTTNKSSQNTEENKTSEKGTEFSVGPKGFVSINFHF